MATYDLSCKKCESSWTLVIPQNFSKEPRTQFVCPSCRSRSVLLEGYDRFLNNSVHELNVKILDLTRRIKEVEDVVLESPDPHLAN